MPTCSLNPFAISQLNFHVGKWCDGWRMQCAIAILGIWEDFKFTFYAIRPVIVLKFRDHFLICSKASIESECLSCVFKTKGMALNKFLS